MLAIVDWAGTIGRMEVPSPASPALLFSHDELLRMRAGTAAIQSEAILPQSDLNTSMMTMPCSTVTA